MDETADQSVPRRSSVAPGTPGIVQVYATDTPVFAIRTVEQPVVIGRGDDCTWTIDDRRASRRHARIAFTQGAWSVEDLDSHNGTYVDADRIDGKVRLAGDAEAVVAIGNAVFLLVPDVAPLRRGVETRDGVVVGPRLAAVWDAIARLAKTAALLHVVGETGSGKELAARRYHAVRCPDAPFVAVNCAAIPPLLAERLLFGAKKGAYSGADADAEGYLVAADGGVVFLDEIGELPLEVQAKLLRACETHEVLALGATRPRSIDLAIVSATHVDLRAAVAAGKFREDLYFRLANPSVELPPLRARREELGWLIASALRDSGLAAHASFVEAALVRPWPGNLRELLGAVATARHLVLAPETQLKMAQLADRAGMAISDLASIGAPDPEVATITAALRAEHGNVTRTARALGIHRNQLRRWLEHHELDPRQFKASLVDDD